MCLWSSGSIVDRLNELMSRLESRFESEKRFNANLAHELRTPVAELKTLAEVAMAWPEEASNENYQDVLDISNQLEQIIETLLMLAREVVAESEEGHSPIALRSLIESSVDVHSRLAEERGLSIVLGVDVEMAWPVPPGMLDMVFNNLIGNAEAYAPIGSTVQIEATEDAQALWFSNLAPDLSPDDVPNLFERLWRKDAARSDAGHSGLGLNVARVCAESAGCRLDAELIEETGVLRFILARIR